MAVGYGAGTIAPPVAARIIANAGTVYTMTEPDGWHDVRPLDASVLTVMLSGPPWARATPSAPASPPQPLEPAVLEALIAAARARLSITRP